MKENKLEQLRHSLRIKLKRLETKKKYLEPQSVNTHLTQWTSYELGYVKGQIDLIEEVLDSLEEITREELDYGEIFRDLKTNIKGS